MEVELIRFWLFTQFGEYIVMRLTASPLLSVGSSRDTCSAAPSIFKDAHLSARAPSVSLTCKGCTLQNISRVPIPIRDTRHLRDRCTAAISYAAPARPGTAQRTCLLGAMLWRTTNELSLIFSPEGCRTAVTDHEGEGLA